MDKRSKIFHIMSIKTLIADILKMEKIERHVGLHVCVEDEIFIIK